MIDKTTDVCSNTHVETHLYVFVDDSAIMQVHYGAHNLHRVGAGRGRRRGYYSLHIVKNESNAAGYQRFTPWIINTNT